MLLGFIWANLLLLRVLDGSAMTAAGKVKEMFYHGFDGYMKHAFPLDELAPLSCRGAGRDLRKPAELTGLISDNYEIRSGLCLTLIESLDTLAVMGDIGRFHEGVDLVSRLVTFDIDQDVLTFEINIRVLGGLLSAHQFCTGDFGREFIKPNYTNELLVMALDLGERLLRAFETPTGLPRALINLRHGQARTRPRTNCPAAAGTFILEFGMLSLLTGDGKFYRAAKRAMMVMWEGRSEGLGLIGFEVDVETGEWLDPASTIGAGTDSFYEYLLKGYLLFGDDELLEAYLESRRNIERSMADGFGLYRTVDSQEGWVRSGRLDALSAFYPGLLALGGEVDLARASFDAYHLQMLRHGLDGLFLPELIDRQDRRLAQADYNLRPEMLESAYHLYRATGDQSLYWGLAGRMMGGLEGWCRTGCGFAVLQEGWARQADRMESFFLAETLKYLYLLFTPHHWLHKKISGAVFSTEAHLFINRKVKLNRIIKCQAPIINVFARDQLRILQAWNTGLSYSKEIWPKEGLTPISQHQCSHLLDSIRTRVGLGTAKLFIFDQQQRRTVMTVAKWMDLQAWPSPSQPAFTISLVGTHHKVIPGQHQVIILRLDEVEDVEVGIGRRSDGTWVVGRSDRLMMNRVTSRYVEGDAETVSPKEFINQAMNLQDWLGSFPSKPVMFGGLPVLWARFLDLPSNLYITI